MVSKALSSTTTGVFVNVEGNSNDLESGLRMMPEGGEEDVFTQKAREALNEDWMTHF